MSGEGESLSKLEYDLAEFLIDYQANHFVDIRAFAYKYNNLKIFMNPRQITKPHFFVKFGISEACFDIATGAKIEGGLGAEDGMVQRWAKRIRVHRELETCWKELMRNRKLNKDKTNKPPKLTAEDNDKKDEVNISAIIRSQQKKQNALKRLDEKWGKKKYGKD